MRLNFLCLASLVSISLGCGADTGLEQASNYRDQDAGVLTDLGTNDNPGTGNSLASEVWFRRQVMAGLAELPAFGIQLSYTVAFVRFQISEDEDGLYSTEQTCNINIFRPAVPEVATTIPEAFIDSMPLNRRGVSMTGDEFIARRIVEVHGARLHDAENDPLPESADDPRVVDQDLDGNPGMTVLIGGLLDGEVHIVQRVKTRLEGRRADDRLQGLLEWANDESIVAASNQLLENPIPLELHPDAERSNFEAVRVDPELDCASLMERVDQFFDPLPEE